MLEKMMDLTIDSETLEQGKESRDSTSSKKKIERQIPPNKPKLTKAERRELQEKQRAAKASNAEPKKSEQKSEGEKTPSSKDKDALHLPKDQSHVSESKVQQLFSHLTSPLKGRKVMENLPFSSIDIHPSVASLGEKFVSGKISGGNARAVALLSALRNFISDYQVPTDKIMSWDLDKKLRPQIAFLIDCRPHSISMGKAIKFLRNCIAKIPPELPESKAKSHLMEEIDSFITERITIAGQLIAEKGMHKIRDSGEVILTFGYSSLVKQVLSEGRNLGKKFRLIVVDSRPNFEGKAMVDSMGEDQPDIECSYVLISAISYIMREVTKVCLGAGALMANGVALARTGTALISMVAYHHRIPVMFCCETYKFSERVQLDSIVCNELGDPAEVLPKSEENSALLHALNLRYDLTPMKYISLVVTEVGIIPPTSIPALIREMNRKEDTADR